MTRKELKILMGLIIITFTVFFNAYAQEPNPQVQLLRIQEQDLQRKIIYLGNLKGALDDRILNLKVTLWKIKEAIQKAQVPVFDASKPKEGK